MEKDIKRKLDGLVLGLQKSLVEAVEDHDKEDLGPKRDFFDGYHHGRMDVYYGVISQINARFNTNYQSCSFPLQEHLAKPCERESPQPSVAGVDEPKREGLKEGNQHGGMKGPPRNPRPIGKPTGQKP